MRGVYLPTGIYNWWKSFIEKHICTKTTLEIQPVMYDGSDPQVAVRIFHKCDDIKMAEVLLNPETIPELIEHLMAAQQTAMTRETFERLKR